MFRVIDILNQHSSLLLNVHTGNMLCMGEISKATSMHPDDLPFKYPEEGDAMQSLSEPILQATPETGTLNPLPNAETNSQPKKRNIAHFFNYLRKGMESLQGLNLEGFKQIYPLFLGIFAAFLLGLAFTLSANVLEAIHGLPLFGGVLQGVSELVGLVAVSRFVTTNLLLQHKRAELLSRIAQLKKELLG